MYELFGKEVKSMKSFLLEEKNNIGPVDNRKTILDKRNIRKKRNARHLKYLKIQNIKDGRN